MKKKCRYVILKLTMTIGISPGHIKIQTPPPFKEGLSPYDLIFKITKDPSIYRKRDYAFNILRNGRSKDLNLPTKIIQEFANYPFEFLALLDIYFQHKHSSTQEYQTLDSIPGYTTFTFICDILEKRKDIDFIATWVQFKDETKEIIKSLEKGRDLTKLNLKLEALLKTLNFITQISENCYILQGEIPLTSSFGNTPICENDISIVRDAVITSNENGYPLSATNLINLAEIKRKIFGNALTCQGITNLKWPPPIEYEPNLSTIQIVRSTLVHEDDHHCFARDFEVDDLIADKSFRFNMSHASDLTNQHTPWYYMLEARGYLVDFTSCIKDFGINLFLQTGFFNSVADIKMTLTALSSPKCRKALTKTGNELVTELNRRFREFATTIKFEN